MAENIEPKDGLGFEKMVYDHLVAESSRDGRDAHMNVGEAEKHLGLSQAQILRAIGGIRAKGYPVIAIATRRTWENDFKIPNTSKEYVEWRAKLIEDMRAIQSILALTDAAAEAKFQEKMPVQAYLF